MSLTRRRTETFSGTLRTTVDIELACHRIVLDSIVDFAPPHPAGSDTMPQIAR